MTPSRSRPALTQIVERLWGPARATGRLVIASGTRPIPQRPGYAVHAVPNGRRPMLLVTGPAGPALGRALTAYPALGQWSSRLTRKALAGACRVGLPLAASTFRVVAKDPGDLAELDPIRALSPIAGSQPIMLLEVRDWDQSGLSTVQIHSASGSPAGHVRLACSAATEELLAGEVETLVSLAGQSGPARVPEVLSYGTLPGAPVKPGPGQEHEPAGHGEISFVTTTPEPVGVNTVKPGGLSIRELTMLHDIRRIGPAGQTRQFRSTAETLEQGRSSPLPESRRVARAALPLLQTVHAATLTLPVTERWHGALSPAHLVREQHGRLWVRDWEFSQEDAVAGLDADHWMLHSRTFPAPLLGPTFIRASYDSDTVLQALGLAPRQRAMVHAVYALTLAARQLSFAASRNSWADCILQPEHLQTFLAGVLALTDRAGQC